ncbi:MAG: UDP-N-acetylmuramoyl-L-alanyl-D-glutamate--2,6-diaminopimelate ligase [Clostridia bacterium]|nr:UDP-N-acetylmuramoyl-L-alanyl-D-glutamate--2,6-diaminopimelate ligase [Clostridia bacterium]
MKYVDTLLALGISLPEKYEHIEVSNVRFDSRRTDENSVFVCIAGEDTDGHDYAMSAYGRGCRAFLSEHGLSVPEDAAVAVCGDTRSALADISRAVYGYPDRELTLVGITGTKGKTTTSVYIADILNDAGIPTGCIGSLGVILPPGTGSIKMPRTTPTTPEASDLCEIFAAMRRAGIKVAVMEVSSQALYKERVRGLTFDTAVFTNLSPDHIGGAEHPTFEHYRDCKARLFSDFGARRIVYNADDEYADFMIGRAPVGTELVSVSALDESADFYAHNRENYAKGGMIGTVFDIREKNGASHKITVRAPGDFSVMNAAAAYAVCKGFGADDDKIGIALSKSAVEGRFEVVDVLPYATFVIDYAHNELSLRSVLSVLRGYNPTRLTVLVGSVGGRTFSRREPIGRAVSELADFCILTADEPDFEDPMKIIGDILVGFEGRNTPYVAIPDRAKAVRFAVKNAIPGEIVLLAGKGHEKTQLINGVHVPFSEREILLEAAKEAETV